MASIIGRKIPTTGVTGMQSGGLGDVFGQFANILSDPLTPALKREKLAEINRQNIGTESLATQFGGGDVNPAQAAATAIRAGYSPADLAKLDIYSTGKRYGPDDPRTTTALTAGGQYHQSPAYAQQELANRLELQRAQEATKLAVAAQTPENVLVNGVPTITRRDQSYGGRPVMPLDQERGAFAAKTMAQPGGFNALTPPEQAFSGAQPAQPTPYNIGLPGGGTQAVTLQGQEAKPVTFQGQPVQTMGKLEGTSADAFGAGDPLEKNLFLARLSTGQASAAIDQLNKDLASPTAGASVGVLGQGAVLLNNILAQARAAGQLAGADAPEVQKGVDVAMSALPPGVAARAQALGIDATQLRSQITNLGYMIAKAQNPSGVITANDFVQASATIGASLQDPEAMIAVLSKVKESLNSNLRAHEELFTRTRGRPAPGAAPSATPSAAPAAPATGGGETVRQNGHTYQKQPDGSYQALD